MRYEQVKAGDEKAVQELSVLASGIVKEYYDPIVGSVQNDYMIEKFQSVPALAEQLDHGYQYYIVWDETENQAGFLGFYPREDELYLSKFYLKRECRRQGIGRDMLAFVRGQAEKMGASAITLNVNKENPTIAIYEKMGFQRLRAEKNDIGHGFFMDDYVYGLQV